MYSFKVYIVQLLFMPFMNATYFVVKNLINMKYHKFISIICLLFFVTTSQSIAQTSENKSETTPIETAKTIMVKVKGVGCARDIQAISTNVVKLDGVSICETVKKGATTTFSVTFAPSLVKEKAIHEAVEDTPGCENQKARPYKVKL